MMAEIFCGRISSGRIFRAALVWLCLLGMLSGCASPLAGPLQRNYGDLILDRVKLGMSYQAADTALADVKQYFIEDRLMDISQDNVTLGVFVNEHYPKDIAGLMQSGPQARRIVYWINGYRDAKGYAYLLFDKKTSLLTGWQNSASEYSRDKYMHEKLTLRLHIPEAYYGYNESSYMHHDEVYAAIGRPADIIPLSVKLDPRLYDDHFWFRGEIPVRSASVEMEVYRYAVADGSNRNVYLVYQHGLLMHWGYDHAWEEGARYLKQVGLNH